MAYVGVSQEWWGGMWLEQNKQLAEWHLFQYLRTAKFESDLSGRREEAPSEGVDQSDTDRSFWDIVQ